jgi:hypothetical protein
MNRDFVEMLSALSEARAEFLVVGAHALAAHGVPRATGDIDILTGVTGLAFEAAWPRRIIASLMGLAVPVIGRDDFLANKRATGRAKDLADIALLTDQEETKTP